MLLSLLHCFPFIYNPEKLDNAGGRCWKDTLDRLRANEVTKTHRSPYQERIGHRLAKRPRNPYEMDQTQKWATTSTDLGLDRVSHWKGLKFIATQGVMAGFPPLNSALASFCLIGS